jgi:hypothetical protein
LKRLAVISLLPLLLFNTVGYYLVYYTDILAAKHEAEVFIWGHDSRSEKLVSLAFPLHDGEPLAEGLRFTDEDEFIYQGRMYDVVSSSRKDGKIIYQCYTDIRETALNQNLCKKVNAEHDTPSQDQKNKSVLKEFAKDYTTHLSDQYHYYSATIVTLIRPTLAEGQPSVYTSVISPPPEA